VSFRDRLDVEMLLEALGIRATRRGRKLFAVCPNPDHPDKSPSWAIVDDQGHAQHGGHHCFSCKFGGGPWELVQAVRGVDEQEASEYVTALILGQRRGVEGVPSVKIRMPQARRGYELPSTVRIPSLDGSEWPKCFREYIESRGVTDDQLERWRIGYAVGGRLAWRMVIPVHTAGRLVAHVARSIFRDGSERYHMPRVAAGASPHIAILGEPLLDPSLGVLTIAEGSFSMLALERAGAPNPVALLGSDWSTGRAAILTRLRWGSVLIATDPDSAGERAAMAIAGSFRQSKVLRLRLDISPDETEHSALRERIIEILSPSGRAT